MGTKGGASVVNINLPINGNGPCGYCDMAAGGSGQLVVLVATRSTLRGFCSEICAEAWLRARRKRLVRAGFRGDE